MYWVLTEEDDSIDSTRRKTRRKNGSENGPSLKGLSVSQRQAPKALFATGYGRMTPCKDNDNSL